MTQQQRRHASAALALAIARAGGVTALAKELEITPAAVSQWEVCPIARVRAVERLTGVSRAELRPDVYGDEEAGR